jgi:hypothetical protein
MDPSFIKCIEEIEKKYVLLSKIHRIRVEKWIEKLVTIGSNSPWKKHRNAYAKLLLSMVIGKNLSEPFNALPPDGPLPSYPFHLKPVGKDMIGVHETTFWRELYSRINQQEAPHEESFLFSKELHSVEATSYNPRMKDSKSYTPSNREVQNLNLLLKEQEKKILYLEQQLHEEKVKHELQIQRINYAHRMEVEKLLKETTTERSLHESFSGLPLPSRSRSPFEKQFSSFYNDEQATTANKPPTSAARLWDQIPTNQSFPSAKKPSFQDRYQQQQQQHSFLSQNGFGKTSNGQLETSSNPGKRVSINEINPSNPISVTNIDDYSRDGGVGGGGNDQTNFLYRNDLVPTKNPSFAPSSSALRRQSDSSQENNNHNNHRMTENLSHISMNEKSMRLKELSSSEDEDFLNYIDQFQNQLQKMKYGEEEDNEENNQNDREEESPPTESQAPQVEENNEEEGEEDNRKGHIAFLNPLPLENTLY